MKKIINFAPVKRLVELWIIEKNDGYLFTFQ